MIINQHNRAISHCIGYLTRQCFSIKSSKQVKNIGLPENWQYAKANSLAAVFAEQPFSLTQTHIGIILSADLYLFSTHALPTNLSPSEIHEFFLTQFQSADQIQEHITVFDYALIQQAPKMATYVAYQARKQAVKSIICAVKELNLRPSLVVPEQAIILNYILQSQQLNLNKQPVFYSLINCAYIFEFSGGAFTGAHYFSNLTQDNHQDLVEWLSSVLIDHYDKVTVMGFISDDLHYLLEQLQIILDDQRHNSQPIDKYHSQIIVVEHLIEIMEQQYDTYQPVTMA